MTIDFAIQTFLLNSKIFIRNGKFIVRLSGQFGTMFIASGKTQKEAEQNVTDVFSISLLLDYRITNEQISKN